MTALWIAVGVLGFLLITGWAAGFLLLAMGRLHLDLGWGRSTHKLGPIEVRIKAPRHLVFELISAPYLHSGAATPEIEVLARSGDLVVASHYTKVHFYTARTVEAVEFESPARVSFKLLTGPVPYVVEDFILDEREGFTELRYGGEFGIDFFFLGRLAGRYWVKGQWEKAVREHFDDLTERAEQLADRIAHERS